MLNVASIVDTSMSDWPGKTVAVVALEGCPMRCPFCFNPDMLVPHDGHEMSVDQILNQIAYMAPILDGVVLTGGEPLMSPTSTLIELMNGIRNMGLKVAVETCGYYPEALQALIESGCIDHVFMDLKGRSSDEAYLEACGVPALTQVMRSLSILFTGDVPFDLRTTIFPDFPTFSDMESMGNLIKMFRNIFENNQFKMWTLQRGLPPEGVTFKYPIEAEFITDAAYRLRYILEMDEISY